jgi:polysaccharide pyruvyl transferase WcaK-like protein
LIDALLKDGSKLSIFHDAAAPVMEFVRDLVAGIDPDQLTLIAPDRSFGEILIEIARCESAFSCTYHGALLSALCGVPSAAVTEEPCMPTLLKSLGLEAFLVPGAELGNAASVIAKISSQRATLSAEVQKRVTGLRKKEAHNIRALDALVPKREVYAKEKQRARDIEETTVDPLEGSGRRRRAPRKRPERD